MFFVEKFLFFLKVILFGIFFFNNNFVVLIFGRLWNLLIKILFKSILLRVIKDIFKWWIIYVIILFVFILLLYILLIICELFNFFIFFIFFILFDML